MLWWERPKGQSKATRVLSLGLWWWGGYPLRVVAEGTAALRAPVAVYPHLMEI
jgi:hypothetical protein